MGEARRDNTLFPPADSPKIVIFLGSPPKLWILVFTHFSASIISRVPKLEVLSIPL